MIYYLNSFYAIVKIPTGYDFPEVNLQNKPENFDAKEESVFLQLLKKEGLEKNVIIDVFGNLLFEEWVEKKILTSIYFNDASISSRAISYYWHKNLGDVPFLLSQKVVLVLGCGGIGSHIAWNLTVLGIGKIYLLDYDTVEISNLNRQLMFDIGDIGKLKTEVLTEKLIKINPSLEIVPINIKIISKEQLEIVITECNPDCIVKCLDSPIYFPKWLDEVCLMKNIKYIAGILSGTAQMIGPTYIPNKTAGYTEFFDINESKDRIFGVGPSLGFVMYQLSGQIAEEVFKLLVGKGDLLYKNKIVVYENLTNETVTLRPKKRRLGEPRGNYKWYNLLNLVVILFIYFLGTMLHLPQLILLGIVLVYIITASVFLGNTRKEVFNYAFINLIYMMLMNLMMMTGNGSLRSLDRTMILSFISLIYTSLGIFTFIIFILVDLLYYIKVRFI